MPGGSDVTVSGSLAAVDGAPRFEGRLEAASDNLRALLADSEIMESHRDCKKVQDPYSLRCMPQIHGASRDALGWVRQVLEREIVAATDNPLVFSETGEVISGGNFHAQIVSQALDLLAIAVVDLAA